MVVERSWSYKGRRMEASPAGRGQLLDGEGRDAEEREMILYSWSRAHVCHYCARYGVNVEGRVLVG